VDIEFLLFVMLRAGAIAAAAASQFSRTTKAIFQDRVPVNPIVIISAYTFFK
jgi:hypothetical protein